MPAGRIEHSSDAGVDVLALHGEHDTSTTVPALDVELTRLLDSGHRIVVDLAPAEFIDSSVISSLIKAHTRSQTTPDGRFAIVAAPDTLPARLLSLVGVSEVAPTFPTRAAAVAAVASDG